MDNTHTTVVSSRTLLVPPSLMLNTFLRTSRSHPFPPRLLRMRCVAAFVSSNTQSPAALSSFPGRVSAGNGRGSEGER